MRAIKLSLVLLFAAVTLSGADTTFKVIVHPTNGVSALSRSEVSDLLLKKRLRWSDGTAVVPVDLSEKSQVRALFSLVIHGRGVTAIKSYWLQEVFAGRLVQPVEKGSDEEVLAFVRANPGAIGYVSGSADEQGVKVLALR